MVGDIDVVLARRLAARAAGLVACILLWVPAVATAATLRVDTTRDEIGARDGRCSLREAIEAVNAPWRRTSCGSASARGNTIVLPPGRFMLTIPAQGSNGDKSGDLNVAGGGPVTITGAGSAATVIDALRLGDRVLSVMGGSKLTLVGVTITGGHATDSRPSPEPARCAAAGGGGGGILNEGTLVLDRVTITGNSAGPGGDGGGVFSCGTLTVIASTLAGNAAGAGASGSHGAEGGDGGDGGGIFSTSGRMRVINSTLFGNVAGDGGPGAGPGSGGSGGDGGAIAVQDGPGVVRNATIAGNGVGVGGTPGSSGVTPGGNGSGGGVFVQSPSPADDLVVGDTIFAANAGPACTGTGAAAIANGGHDLSFGDHTCPGAGGNPELGPLKDNGGPTETMAIGPASVAIKGVPRGAAGCPPTDQRGVRRPHGRACDIGAYQFATPSITLIAPFQNAAYERGSRIIARFRCAEGGVASAIATCIGSVARGHPIVTARPGSVRFVVTALDKSGNRTARTVDYSVFDYVDPLREVSGLTPRRIDLGVDYAGSGPLLAIGRGKVTFASNVDSGPPSCWAISCWPGGGIVVYRLLDGPFAGRYVYVAEHITVTVSAGQTVTAGQQLATLHSGYPWSEWGWAAGPGPEALAMSDGHRCPCSDPGDWSTIDGRTMNQLLVALGAPSGLLQANTPSQRMPAGWPSWRG